MWQWSLNIFIHESGYYYDQNVTEFIFCHKLSVSNSQSLIYLIKDIKIIILLHFVYLL